MIARRAEELAPFMVMEVLERAREMERQGEDIIHLEVGEPDFDFLPQQRRLPAGPWKRRLPITPTAWACLFSFEKIAQQLQGYVSFFLSLKISSRLSWGREDRMPPPGLLPSFSPSLLCSRGRDSGPGARADPCRLCRGCAPPAARP